MAKILQYTKPYSLQRISGTITEPLTLSITKNYLRVDNNDDDALIAELIITARHFAENYIGASLTAQIFEAMFHDELPNFIVLPMSPIASISSITTEDLSGNQVILPINAYRLSGDRYLHFHQYFNPISTKIRYITANTFGLQSSLKRAMLAHIAIMYDMRGDAPTPNDSLTIYNQHKQVRL